MKPHIWRRIFVERLAEPLHLTLLSIPVALFGSFRTKVDFDICVRQHFAYGLLRAADLAKQEGIDRITALEFGVANGAGLVNLVDLASKVTKTTGVKIDLFGFDTGKGLPAPIDYRDHPEAYFTGDYPMTDRDALLARLEGRATVIFGEVAETVPEFLKICPSPIGFVAMDLDYYSSTLSALNIFAASDPEKYLYWVTLYADDVLFETHNASCGQMLAMREFTANHPMRAIHPYNVLRTTRIFQRTRWIDQMYICHILDHPRRQVENAKAKAPAILSNPF
jgi:hypothetical protein